MKIAIRQKNVNIGLIGIWILRLRVYMFFVNKQKQIEQLMGRYYASVSECIGAFKGAIVQYFANHDRQVLKSASAGVHRAESTADDIRRQIEDLMYSKALFPESRGDILGLLETMDKVPNQTETAVMKILNEHIEVPAELCERIIELIEISCRCVDAMIDAAEKLFSEFTAAAVAVGKIDELESKADRIEAELIESIFGRDMDGASKILLRDFVKSIAGITDRAENVGDRIRIIVAKRSV